MFTQVLTKGGWIANCGLVEVFPTFQPKIPTSGDVAGCELLFLRMIEGTIAVRPTACVFDGFIMLQ